MNASTTLQMAPNASNGMFGNNCRLLVRLEAGNIGTSGGQVRHRGLSNPVMLFATLRMPRLPGPSAGAVRVCTVPK